MLFQGKTGIYGLTEAHLMPNVNSKLMELLWDSPLGPTLANVFLCYHEQIAIASSHQTFTSDVK